MLFYYAVLLTGRTYKHKIRKNNNHQLFKTRCLFCFVKTVAKKIIPAVVVCLICLPFRFNLKYIPSGSCLLLNLTFLSRFKAYFECLNRSLSTYNFAVERLIHVIIWVSLWLSRLSVAEPVSRRMYQVRARLLPATFLSVSTFSLYILLK